MRSIRAALGLYAALFLALTFPFWLQGEVVAPYRPSLELGLAQPPAGTRIENRKFSDHPNEYVPEVAHSLRARRASWLALWTGENELGRPFDQAVGFTAAYVPSGLLLQLTASPERFLTLLSWLYCFLAGLFMLGWCRERRLAPAAGLVAAVSLMAAPAMLYWLTFPMFLASWCWSAGVLFALARLRNAVDAIGWSLLAFCLYSLLMAAYKQDVVYHAYLFAGFAAYLGRDLVRGEGRGALARFAVAIATAAAFAGVLALPAYADLARLVADSARAAPDAGFFAAVLPKVDSWSELARFVALSTFPDVFGNPIAPGFPLRYDGLGTTPIVVFLGAFALIACLRATWGWWLAIGVLVALTLSPALHTLAVRFLGFNLSRAVPVSYVLLPAIVIAAHAADVLLRSEGRARWPTLLGAGALSIALLGVVVGYGMLHGIAIRWDVVAILAGIVALMAAAGRVQSSPYVLTGALALALAFISFPLLLRQPPGELARTSPLVESLRQNLPEGARFAVVSRGLGVLPPNFNATLGLPSIHTYNSLSSRRYHRLVEALGGETRTYGRLNDAIAPDYGGLPFWMSDIGLVLASSRIEHPNLEPAGEVAGVHLHRVRSRMGCCAQVAAHREGERVDPRTPVLRAPRLAVALDDFVEVEGLEAGASTLVLSRKFHESWRAAALTAGGWQAARTFAVNDVFQGVALPAGASRVRLEYLPWVRFSWIAYVAWGLVAAFLVWRWKSRR